MDIVLRATVMFFLVFGLLRLLGKRELAEMTPFELVLLVVIGDLLQQGVTHNDFSLTGATLAISTFAFWSLVLGLVAMRSRRVEAMLDGEPAVLVRHGELLRDMLKRNRLTLNEFEAEMRLAGIARVAEVEWAILETNGKISFIEAKGAA
ncbi:DUF421 domain-containing protein [Alteraurantiacibacter buctensis]|uniref:DUF421 domain-containing protein n=1 Tax=Alteraurantiacibacter buctensis TaxID=1503981 RepID=A0A844YR31_9SPHN|nr:YetF domain-containing protein [Alteraurantiacibacter buctensis]MXO70805.1 DUF421 domain-containing protein [Alteraurantiacibacter buctensis]